MDQRTESAAYYTVDELTYDPAAHKTTRPDGKDVPHVTGILRALGVATDFSAIADGSARRAAAIQLAGERGTAVHADCHAYDDNDLDWETVDPRVRPYVEAWAQCCRDMHLVPVARERRLYHPAYNYTGIMDGVFERRGGRILLDIKTGDPENAACHLQLAAYQAAYEVQHPHDLPIDERWAVWLKPEKRIPYAVKNYSAREDAHNDIHVFHACLVTYNNQAARRPRIFS